MSEMLVDPFNVTGPELADIGVIPSPSAEVRMKLSSSEIMGALILTAPPLAIEEKASAEIDDPFRVTLSVPVRATAPDPPEIGARDSPKMFVRI
jgi:hypothetical protein